MNYCLVHSQSTSLGKMRFVLQNSSFLSGRIIMSTKGLQLKRPFPIKLQLYVAYVKKSSAGFMYLL